MITFDYSFKPKKAEVEDKYPNLPVLTFLGGETTQKFSLNKKAADMLGYSGKEVIVTGKMISFSPVDGVIAIINTTGIKTPFQAKVNIDNTFSNSVLVTKIKNFLKIEIKEPMEFLLEEGEEVAKHKYLILSGSEAGSYTVDTFDKYPDQEVLVNNEVSVETTETEFTKSEESFENETNIDEESGDPAF